MDESEILTTEGLLTGANSAEGEPDQVLSAGTSKWLNGKKVRANAKGAYKFTFRVIKNAQVRTIAYGKAIPTRITKPISITAAQKIWITSAPKNVETDKPFTVTGKTTPGLRGVQLSFGTGPIEDSDRLGGTTVSSTGTFTASLKHSYYARGRTGMRVLNSGIIGVPAGAGYTWVPYSLWSWMWAGDDENFGGVRAAEWGGSWIGNVDGSNGSLMMLGDSGKTSDGFTLRLGRAGMKCDTMRFTAGVEGYPDPASTRAAVKASLTSGTRTLWSKDGMKVGNPYPVTVGISGLSQLTFKASISGASVNSNPPSTFALLHPELRCTGYYPS